MSDSKRQTLIEDLTQQRHDKLKLWVRDTLDLFDMADLSADEAMATALSETLGMSASIINKWSPKMSSNDVAAMMYDLMEHVKRREKARAKKTGQA